MDRKNEIGGYFELELNLGKNEWHPNALKLNSGRYCLQYILQAKKYKKVYLPYYICDSVLQPIKNENVSYEFYSINENFEPIFDGIVKDDECFLYVNYFGINEKNVEKIVLKHKNVIIDNTQAFFNFPFKNTDTFYSTRKFFGVPDGAYLYISKDLSIHLHKEISLNRMDYLLKRIESSANDGYNLFRNNESYFDTCGLHEMSKLTETILGSIDYEKCREIRNHNFLYLHEKLSKYNDLDIDLDNLNGPMVYPFMNYTPNLRDKLIENKIYVATYWNEVKDRVNEHSFENKFVDYLIPLPIDQRYDFVDMSIIIEAIESLIV